MALQMINNFVTSLSAAIDNVQTTIDIPNAAGARLQQEVFDGANTIKLTLVNGSDIEVMTASAQTQDGGGTGIARVTVTRADEQIDNTASPVAKNFALGTAVEARSTAGDMEANFRNMGGGGGVTFIENQTGGTVNIDLDAQATNDIVIASRTISSTTYNLQITTGAGNENKFFRVTVFQLDDDPGQDGSVTVNGSAVTAKTNSGEDPITWSGGQIDVMVYTDGSGVLGSHARFDN